MSVSRGSEPVKPTLLARTLSQFNNMYVLSCSFHKTFIIQYLWKLIWMLLRDMQKQTTFHKQMEIHKISDWLNVIFLPLFWKLSLCHPSFLVHDCLFSIMLYWYTIVFILNTRTYFLTFYIASYIFFHCPCSPLSLHLYKKSSHLLFSCGNLSTIWLLKSGNACMRSSFTINMANNSPVSHPLYF
jgi:hypothetical protein